MSNDEWKCTTIYRKTNGSILSLYMSEGEICEAITEYSNWEELDEYFANKNYRIIEYQQMSFKDALKSLTKSIMM